MSDKFKLCGSGKNQSPIDIKSQFDVDLPPIAFDYKGAAKRVVNNGHTIQVDIANGSQITLDNKVFKLKQFHFHTPSENTINGAHFPLEMHFVHRNSEGKIYAVVAMMFKEGDENPILQRIWNQMPAKAGQKVKIKTKLPYVEFIPKNQDYYRFNGSFTTPPCTEGVRWVMLKEVLTASKAQIKQFLDVMGHPNNRNIQETRARIIVD